MILLKKEKSCGAIIYKYDNSCLYILLLKHNLGHWSFAKGHMESSESEIDTALREIKEETNLDVEIDSNFREVSFYSPKKNTVKEVVFFLATPTSYEYLPQVSEIELVEWFLVDDALKQLTYENDRQVLKKADYYLSKKLTDN